MAGDKTSGSHPSDHQGTSPLWEIMRRACSQIAEIEHKGNMTTRAEAYDMSAVFILLGQAIGFRADAYRRESLNPVFTDLYTRTEASLYALADQLLPLGAWFDDLHPERVRDLVAGSNPAGWDTTNNQTVG